MRELTKLRLALDPNQVDVNGPEIHWILRLLLTGAGWAWEEVALEDACDLAYVQDPAQAPLARLIVCASPDAWRRRDEHRLHSLGYDGALIYPRYSELDQKPELSAQADQVVCRRDLLFDVFWLATGREERYWPVDRHGFFDLSDAALWRSEVQGQALASRIRAWLEQSLRDLGCPPPQPPWPDGRRAAALAGHDVDYPEVKRAIEPLRVVARQGWRGLPSAIDVLTGRRHHWQFPAWMQLEQSLGMRSAFYFVARQGSLIEYATGTPDPFYDVTQPRFRALFRELIQQGFEIGLHASYRACESADQFASEKLRLEEACGRAVLGNRHHYWHLDPDNVERTLLIHERVGLEYDSSLTHNRYLGWRRGLSQPFFPWVQAERRELSTLQIPIAWMDDQLFGMRADNPGDPWERLQWLAGQAAELSGCFVIDIHEYVFDDVLFPGWTALYAHVCSYLRERGDFWFATPAEVSRHWQSRYRALVRASSGLHLGLPAGLLTVGLAAK